VDDKGNVAIQRISVVGADGGGMWLEIDRQDYFHHTITKILYSPHATKTPDEAADVLMKVVTKTDDKPVQTIDFCDHGRWPVCSRASSKLWLRPAWFPPDVAQAPRKP